MDLRGASAEALGALTEQLDGAIGSSKAAAQLGDELFTVSQLIRGEAGLRRFATDASLRDDSGRPRRRGAEGALPGVWYLGLRWLTRRRSGNFFGFPADAATVADAVATTLRQARDPVTA